MLMVNAERGQNYSDSFVPFVAECMRTSPHQAISLADMQEAIRRTFGLAIPQGALKVVLERAVAQGYARKQGGVYFRNAAKLAESEFGQQRHSLIREQEALVDKLIGFCSRHYNVRWSNEEAEAALLAYFRERAIPVLALTMGQSPLPTDSIRVEHSDFLINAFVVHLNERDPAGFAFLDKVTKGSMLIDVLLYPDIQQVSGAFDGVEFYFDTPLLLRALGFIGPHMEAPCRELLALLQAENARLRCFEHTELEVRGVLHATATALHDPNSAKAPPLTTTAYFRSKGFTSADVHRELSRLDKSLASLNIETVAKPAHVENLTLDESRLEAVLQTTVNYRNDGTLSRDLESLSAIFRLRDGRFPPRIESSICLMVTTNSSLAKASACFFAEQYPDAKNGTPLCMLDYPLTAIVWLKQPLKAPDLPRNILIADSYAALNPSDKLWRLFLDRVERLKAEGRFSSDEYLLLRESFESKKALADITFGEAAAFAEGTVDEVFERARAAARAETEAVLASTLGQLEDEQQARLTAEQEVSAVHTRAEEEAAARKQRIHKTSMRWAHRAALMLTSTVVLLVAFFTYLALPAAFPDLLQGPLRFVAPIVIVVAALALAILNLASIVAGTTILSIVRRVEPGLAQWLEEMFLRATTPGE